MNWTFLTAANSSAAARRPSGAIAAACARPPIDVPASVRTKAAVNDAINFVIGFFPVGLQGAMQPRNTHVHRRFQMPLPRVSRRAILCITPSPKWVRSDVFWVWPNGGYAESRHPVGLTAWLARAWLGGTFSNCAQDGSTIQQPFTHGVGVATSPFSREIDVATSARGHELSLIPQPRLRKISSFI